METNAKSGCLLAETGIQTWHAGRWNGDACKISSRVLASEAVCCGELNANLQEYLQQASNLVLLNLAAPQDAIHARQAAQRL